MKSILFILSFLFLSFPVVQETNSYNKNYVDILVDQAYLGENFDYIIMKRDSQKVKAAYFAENINSIKTKYQEFAKTKNIICYAAAGYLGGNYDVVKNLTIVSGKTIESNLNKTEFDALVIIYATGGVVVSNLKNGDLKLQGSGADPNQALNLRKNDWDLTFFKEWCAKEKATVFQTHLLAYNNNLIIANDADEKAGKTKSAVRRFLVVGKNSLGKLKHIVINCRKESGLRHASEKCFNFCKTSLGINVTFMINLDTGAQNVFGAYNADGTVNNSILKDGGVTTLDKAHNLLVYYYE
jgi:hypothetical protein